MVMTFQWTVSLGQVLSTITILGVMASFYLLSFGKARRQISRLQREVDALKVSITQLKVLLKIEADNG